MRRRLKKMSWNSEQVDYVMKKYYRKNTGLPWFKSDKQINPQIRKFPDDKNLRRYFK